MKHLLIFLLAFPFFASAQILEKQFVATVQYNGFTQINDSLYRGDLIEFRDVLIEGYQPSGVDSGFICLDGTGRAYRVEVVNSFDYSSLNVDLIELDDYDKIPVGVGIVAERYGSTYQIPNGLVNSIGISAVLQAKILNHNTKIAATTVQPPDTLYIQELSGTTAISNGDTIPLIDYVRVVDTPAMLLNYPSTAGYGIIDGGKTWRADTTSPNGLATRLFAKTLPTTIAANYAAVSNGTSLIARNLFDNNTYAGVISRPWKFGEFTTASLPTGVNGYWLYNTDIGPGWYDGTRWNYVPKADRSTFTSTYIPYTGTDGRLTQTSSLRWDQSISELFVDGSFRPANLQAISTVNIHNIGGLRFAQNANPGGVGFRNDIGSGNWYFAGNGNAVTTGTFIWEVVNNGSMGPSNNGKFFQYRGKFNSGNGPSAGATWKYMSIEPEYNFTTTNAFTIYGWDYGPVLTGLTSANVTHNAIRVQTGNVLLNTISGKTGIGAAFTPGEELDINGDTRVRDSLRVSTLPNQTSATKVLTADASGWVGYRDFSSFENIYNTNGTFGAGRIGTLTDSLRFRFGGNDIFRLKSNGVAYFTMPTESNSFVLTSSPSENYNNYRGNVFMVGTTSNGDTTTGVRRNNHEASYFSGINLVEGGDNVYYDAVAGYGNIVRGTEPKNIVYGVFNTVLGVADVGVYGYRNVVSGRGTTVFGRDNNVSATDAVVIGRSNTVTQNNSYVYGSSIASTNASLHGFGTLTPRKRMDINGDLIVGDTIYNTSPATHSAIDGFAVWKSTGLGYALGKATFGAGLSYSAGVLSATGSSDGNGIYSNSGTLANHTTRARIPDNGNLLFSQNYNSMDSAYIQVINGLDGNREVRLGVTDTMSTGFATLVLKQDADNEVMSWQLRSSDNEGQTVLEGDGGNISMAVDEGYEVQISGLIRAKQEAYNEITSTSSPQTLSSDYSDNLINQGSTQATFTLNMPASPDDGQVCTITFNNAITTLTIDGNGETIVGSAVVTGVAGSQRKFKFYSGIGWIKLY